MDYLIEALDINCKSFCNSLIYSKKIIKNHNIILNCLKNTNIEELNKIEIKKILNKIEKNLFEQYLDISKVICRNEKKINNIIDILKEIEENNECYTIKNLKINGNDIIYLGYKNKEIGDILNNLLEAVIVNPKLNNKELLIKKIKEI